MSADASVLLRRSRLHDALAHTDARLSVITGPSGFGKTSLVRAWVATLRGHDVAWVTLESDVESRSAFWQTVLAAAGRSGLMGAPVPGLLSEVESTDDPAAVIARGLGTRAAPLLVVDAYERARTATAQVDTDLTRLADLVPQLRIVVTTRTSVGLADPARSLRGEVHLLTGNDLAFTLAETRELLATFAPPGTGLDAEHLHHVTRGYPLALRAALLEPPRSAALFADAGWQRLVADDLRRQLQQRDALDFVLVTSVPPYFDADLALQLAPQLGSAARVKEVLDELEWNGFGRWIPFAPGTQVFQYVESLREAMLGEIRTWPAEERDRASGLSALWLLQQGSYEAALEMAVSAGLFAIAARVYAAVVGTNQDAASASLVDRHLASVPISALAAYPALAFGRGLACYRDPSLRGAAADYFRIAAGWERPRLPNATAAEHLLGHVARTVSLRLLGRFVPSARSAEHALAFNEAIPPGERDLVAPLQPMVLRQLGWSLFLAGRTEAAREATLRGVAAATEPVSRNHSVAHAVALTAFEGHLVRARAVAALTDATAWRPGEERSHVNAPGRVGLAVLALDDFDFAGALAAYDGCEAFCETSEFWPLITWTRLHAQVGLGNAGVEARAVTEQLHRTLRPPGTGDSVVGAALRAALATAWLAAGNGGRAMPLLRAPTRYAGQLAPAVLLAKLLGGDAAGALATLPVLERRSGHTARSLAATLAFAAAAAARLGQEESAAALLERSWAQAGAGSPRLHLGHLPAEDLARLREVAAALTDPQVQAHLGGGVPSCFEVATPDVVTLSARERAVVTAMQQHPTRTAVAAALHLSENTVKTHLQRIYRKLGVNSRDGVLRRALELDLLDDF